MEDGEGREPGAFSFDLIMIILWGQSWAWSWGYVWWWWWWGGGYGDQCVWISLLFRTLEDDLGTEWCCNVACPVSAEVLEQEKCPVSKTAIYKDMRIWGYVVALYWDALASKMPQSAEQRYEADTSIHFIFANHSAHHTQAFQYISSSIILRGKAKVFIKVSISLNAHF